MKTILIKLSGELFDHEHKQTEHLQTIVQQLKDLATQCQIGIVVGAGNLFRGNVDGPAFGLLKATAHEIGMIATIMNGRILQAQLEKATLSTTLLSAIHCSQVALPVRQQVIDEAQKQKRCVIFVGGTGNPFFTNDTNAIVRALQMNADEVWKVTHVDGVYSADPKIDPTAKLLASISYEEAITRRLGIMDHVALILAQEHTLPIRIFNGFTPHALLNAHKNKNFGSTISK